MSDDLIDRLGRELRVAAERQAAGGATGSATADAGWRGWLRRRPRRRAHGRLLVAAAAVAIAGAGATAGLIAERGEVGGPPSLTFSRLSPEQVAGGVRELTRPVVIGHGRLPQSGWAWQLIAFQTTRGLCIAIDFPRIANIGGGCGTNVPRQGRAIDWQGHLARLGSASPVVLLGAVTASATDVRVAHGYRERRGIERAQIVRVSDPAVLDHIEVRDPFAYYVAEISRDAILQKAVAFDAAGRRLGAAGVPNGGAGSAGFVVRDPDCDAPPPDEVVARDVPIPLPGRAREEFAVLRRPQRPADRPEQLVRTLTLQDAWPGAPGEVDVGGIRRLGSAPDGRPLFLVAFRTQPPSGPRWCLRTTTPRLRREEQRQRRAAQRVARIVRVQLVGEDGIPYVQTEGGALGSARAYGGGASVAGRRRYLMGLVPDGVASVTATFSDGTSRTVAVHDNHWAAAVPRAVRGAIAARQVWRDAAGRIVRVPR